LIKIIFNAFALIFKSAILTINLQGERIMTNSQDKSQVQQEEITMNLKKIEQFKQEVDQKMIDGIYQSKFFEFLVGQGLEGKAVKVKVVLDLKEIRETEIIDDKELRDSLRELPGQEYVLTSCWPCNGGQWCN